MVILPKELTKWHTRICQIYLLTLAVKNNLTKFAMKIYFENKKLSKILNDDKAISKKYGQIADKIRVRLSEIAAADNLEDLRYVAGNFHELIGNRKGQLACSLKEPYRLIFKPVNEPLPIKRTWPD